MEDNYSELVKSVSNLNSGLNSSSNSSNEKINNISNQIKGILNDFQVFTNKLQLIYEQFSAVRNEVFFLSFFLFSFFFFYFLFFFFFLFFI
jgi:predicted PurR-regulated permease PerM